MRFPPRRTRVAASRVVKLSEKLRCLVCQNQSIADSSAELAQDLRRQIREQVAAGKTDDEIVDLHGGALRRFRALRAAGQGDDGARSGRARRCCSSSASRASSTWCARAAPSPPAPPLTTEERDRAAQAPRGRRREGHRVTPFVLIAVAMVAIALAWVLVPLLRRGTTGIAREASNVAILRDQLRELDADLATGTMPRDRYEQAKRELEARAIEESREVARPAAAPSQSAAWTAAIIAGAIPIAALLLYVALGNHDAFSPVAARAAKGGAEHEVTPQEIEAMAAKLAARLQNEPDNVDGWVMLARTYYALNRHADAARAFDRAVALIPDNADLLADYADALGAAEGGLAGQVARAHRTRAQGRSDALEGAGARRHRRVQPQGLPARGRVLGADEGDRSAGLAHCRVDRRQHRRGAGAGRPRGRSGGADASVATRASRPPPRRQGACGPAPPAAQAAASPGAIDRRHGEPRARARRRRRRRPTRSTSSRARPRGRRCRSRS